MSKVSATRLFVLCAAITACADNGTPRTVTGPDARPSLSEAAADLPTTYEYDAPFDLVIAGEDASVPQSASLMAAATSEGIDSRASGHVGFPLGLPRVGLADEKYSFSALSTDLPTFTAKGEYELNLTTVTGVTNKVHGEVVCMGITGNTARIAGQITKVWRNGVQIPITARTHNVWVVIDNGEGQGTPDFVSPMGFQTAALAATHCAVGTPTIVFNNQEGNIQVR